MPTLSDYSNVSGEAIKLLEEKGYQVWIDQSAKMYCAERDGWDFMADSPTALLGVVAIYEHKQPTTCREYWWSSGAFDRAGSLPRKPPREYVSRIYSDKPKQALE